MKTASAHRPADMVKLQHSAGGTRRKAFIWLEEDFKFRAGVTVQQLYVSDLVQPYTTSRSPVSPEQRLLD